MGRLVVASLVLALMASGCATRNCPYRSVGPALGGVHAPEIPGRGAHSTVAGCVRRHDELERSEPERSEPERSELPRPGEPVAYAVVVRRGVPQSTLLAQVESGLRLNAFLHVTCSRGGKVLKTWSGHTRWDGDMPVELAGAVRGGRIRWEDDADVTGVRVNTTSKGHGGQELTDWLHPAADAIRLRVKPLTLATGESTTGALGTQRTKTRARAATTGKAQAGSGRQLERQEEESQARAGRHGHGREVRGAQGFGRAAQARR